MSEFVHMELSTTDQDEAKKFYKSVFGWKYQEMPMPNGQTYTMASGADGPFGGIQTHPMPGAPSQWLGYVGVKSLKRTVANVEKAGGRVLMQQKLPGMGTLAVFVDPQGAAIAAWEAATPAKKKTAKKKTAKKKTKRKRSKKR